ncbi:MAG: glucosamine-6-phosphate deaminase [Candidatus Moranbacteria bacterium]|nr:glucosamine-6-phosphate deaminase [Candidatus Moranbacteria bacterium]
MIKIKQNNSKVENYYQKKSGYKLQYPPTEKAKLLMLDNFPIMGKLTALRFIEWVLENNDGVVALPTGKTPEHFIKWSKYILQNWNKKEIKQMLSEHGLKSGKKPKINRLKFVQIDDFYPIYPKWKNSFYYYVNKYYLKDFGFSKEKALLIDPSRTGLKKGEVLEDVFPNFLVDLSLRYRKAKTKLETRQKSVIQAVDEFCRQYEEKIRDLGGIGFFLGGIGPDGHIAFNVSGSDFHSDTRLTNINYETAAAAATDLGGIEVSRKRLVITIGLETIAYNPDVCAIVIAAGEAKSEIVAKAVQEKASINCPASILQRIKNGVFYLTKGAAKQLEQRNLIALSQRKKLDEKEENKIIIDHSLKNKIQIKNIKENKAKKDKFLAILLQKSNKKLNDLKKQTKKSLTNSIEKSQKSIKNEIILHTNPHHDDEMLGYYPLIRDLIKEESNKNYFNYLTSGFTSVSNIYVLKQVKTVLDHIEALDLEKKFKNKFFKKDNFSAKDKELNLFNKGVAKKDEKIKATAVSLRMTRNLLDIYQIKSVNGLLIKLNEIIRYLKSVYPGQKDEVKIQKFKGAIREWEAEIVWNRLGIRSSQVIHSRLGFYKGDIFTEQPKESRDMQPVYELLKKIKPTIITVALDPEGSGPDTHYKVLQAVSGALEKYVQKTGRTDIKIWGYRNVWDIFHLSEINLAYPVSLGQFSQMHDAFINSYGSQKKASFPSYKFDGPFSLLSRQIMISNLEKIKTCLGKDYFLKSNNRKITSAKGFLLIKEMGIKEFFEKTGEIKGVMENIL